MVTVYAIVRLVMWKQLKQAWFKKCHFRVTPEIDRALTVRGFLVLGVTLIRTTPRPALIFLANLAPLRPTADMVLQSSGLYYVCSL